MTITELKTNVHNRMTSEGFLLDIATMAKSMVDILCEEIPYASLSTINLTADTDTNLQTNLLATQVGIQTDSENRMVYKDASGTYRKLALTTDFSAPDLSPYLKTDGSRSLTANWDSDGQGTLYIDRTNKRVGINTTSPSQLLTVNGVGMFGTADQDEVLLGASTNVAGHKGIGIFHDSNVGYLYCVSPGVSWHDFHLNCLDFTVNFGASERVRFKGGSGRVGVGIVEPTTLLEVNGDISLGQTSALYYGTGGNTGASGNYRSRLTSGDFIEEFWASAGVWSEKTRLTAAGHFGVGGSPADAHVYGTTNTQNFWAASFLNTNQYGSGLYVKGGGHAIEYPLLYVVDYSNNVRLSVNGLGNTGLGGLSPSDSRLGVKGSGTTSGAYAIAAVDSADANLFYSRNDGYHYMKTALGIGTTAPDTTLHVHNASAGTVSAATGSVAVLEKNDDCYLSFLTPANKKAGILWGDPNDNAAGGLWYQHETSPTHDTITLSIGKANNDAFNQVISIYSAIGDSASLDGMTFDRSFGLSHSATEAGSADSEIFIRAFSTSINDNIGMLSFYGTKYDASGTERRMAYIKGAMVSSGYAYASGLLTFHVTKDSDGTDETYFYMAGGKNYYNKDLQHASTTVKVRTEGGVVYTGSSGNYYKTTATGSTLYGLWYSTDDSSYSEKCGWTEYGGFYVTMSVAETLYAGEIVYQSRSGTANAVTKVPAGGDMPIGVMYADASVGQVAKVVVAGKALVKPEAGISLIQGYVAYVSPTEAGRAANDAAIPSDTNHWREIGHVLQTSSGNGVAALCILHFN